MGDPPVPIFVLDGVGKNKRYTLHTETVNDLIHTGTVKPVISIMAGNGFFNGVFASYIRTMRCPVGFKLAVLFCESCRESIHRKAAKFLPLFLDVFIRPAFDAVPDHIHVVALDILKIMEDFIQRRR